MREVSPAAASMRSLAPGDCAPIPIVSVGCIAYKINGRYRRPPNRDSRLPYSCGARVNFGPSIPHKLSNRRLLAYQREFGVVGIVWKVDHFRGDKFQLFRAIIFMVLQDSSHNFLCRLQFVGMPCRMPLAWKGLCEGI